MGLLEAGNYATISISQPLLTRYTLYTDITIEMVILGFLVASLQRAGASTNESQGAYQILFGEFENGETVACWRDPV